jgi:hypothetical protein
MAITINQDPTSPNMANNTLVFSVSSTQVAQPQFQYVADVRNEAGTLIQRVKQQPNPTGYGVFDLSQIIKFNVGPADGVWKTTVAQDNSGRGCSKDFKIYFGEEYGTSASSSVTSYTGIGVATGSAAVSGSNYYTMLDGLVGPNDKVSWNWASSSKLDEHTINDTTFNFQFGLTDFPATQSINTTDYQTISLLNGNLTGVTSSLVAQDVWLMEVKEYDITGSEINTEQYYNNSDLGNGGPRVSNAQIWADVDQDQNQDTRLIHFPAGPQNFADAGNTLNANTAYYVCTFYEQATDGFPNENGKWGTYRFDLNTDCEAYTPVRFAWKNKYGVWDYYSYTLVSTTTANIERQNYEQSFVNFSSTSTSVSYDKTRRGNTNYYNEINKQRTVESDWLDQTYADLLNEMFYSADVYIQEGSDFLPVVMTNASITEKTNPRGQKLFKYTAEYRLANDEQPRL